MNKFLTLLISVLSISTAAFANCDPNANCTQRISYKCAGTWKDPVRTCEKSWNEPVCETQKLACRTQCSKTNKDAEMYILNAQTEIRNLEEKIESNKMVIRNQQFSADFEAQDGEKLLNLWSKTHNSTVELQVILAQQESIQAFVQEMQQQPQNPLASKEGIAATITQINESKPAGYQRITWYLKAVLLVNEQSTALQSKIYKVNPTTPIVKLIEELQEQENALMALWKRSNEKVRSHKDFAKGMTSTNEMYRNEVVFQRGEIQRQESRKCSSIL